MRGREKIERERERERELKTVCVVLYCSRCSMARSVTLGRESIARNEMGTNEAGGARTAMDSRVSTHGDVLKIIHAARTESEGHRDGGAGGKTATWSLTDSTKATEKSVILVII